METFDKDKVRGYLAHSGRAVFPRVEPLSDRAAMLLRQLVAVVLGENPRADQASPAAGLYVHAEPVKRPLVINGTLDAEAAASIDPRFDRRDVYWCHAGMGEVYAVTGADIGVLFDYLRFAQSGCDGVLLVESDCRWALSLDMDGNTLLAVLPWWAEGRERGRGTGGVL